MSHTCDLYPRIVRGISYGVWRIYITWWTIIIHIQEWWQYIFIWTSGNECVCIQPLHSRAHSNQAGVTYHSKTILDLWAKEAIYLRSSLLDSCAAYINSKGTHSVDNLSWYAARIRSQHIQLHGNIKLIPAIMLLAVLIISRYVVMVWKHFPCSWPYEGNINWSATDSLIKSQ